MTVAVSPELDIIRGCADQAKKCAEPYITTQVTIRKRRWTEGRLESGIAIDTDLVLPKRFHVRQPNGREIASSGGRISEYDAIVEDISPVYQSHGGGGFTDDQLDPTMHTLPKPLNDTEILYVLEGGISGIFSLVSLNSSDPVSWSMLLRNTRLSP